MRSFAIYLRAPARQVKRAFTSCRNLLTVFIKPLPAAFAPTCTKIRPHHAGRPERNVDLLCICPQSHQINLSRQRSTHARP